MSKKNIIFAVIGAVGLVVIAAAVFGSGPILSQIDLWNLQEERGSDN